jgi:quercetin dioxygenase-like cupin family protein
MGQLESVTSLEEAARLGRALPLTALPGPHPPDRSIGSIGVGFRLGGEHTGGQVAIVEHPFPPGALVPPHLHTREDEFSIVTAGQIGFRSGPDEVVLGPGGYIVKPRGELHTMWNAGTDEARMIEVITPAGFERFFAELADMLEAGPPDPSDIAALGNRYGLFFDPASSWVPELVEKYHLNSPFG